MQLAALARSYASFFLLSLPAAAGGNFDPHQEEVGPPVLTRGELVLDQYYVRNVNPPDLWQLASSFVGRNFFVKENGGANQLNSMRLLGRTIILYDTKEQVQRARELLERLDTKPQEREDSASQSVEYKPHFVSLETAIGAVKLLVNQWESIEERGLIVLRDDQKSIDAALALLKRIDVPERQVLLTVQMIDVGLGQQGPPLPKELLDNLQKLLPQSQFAQTGMAMLKTSVGGNSSISIGMECAGNSYHLTLVPVAFDESTTSLTVANCTLIDENRNKGNPIELFRTNTVLRGGEYTVLASTGATPRLLVVRVTPQG